MTRLLIYLFLAIGLFPNGIQAKWSESYKDSLQEVIATASGEDYIDAHLRLAQGYMRPSPDSGIIHAQAGLEAALEENHLSLAAKAYDLYGRGQFRKGRLDLANNCYQKALEIAQANRDELHTAHLNNSLAILYLEKGFIEKSLPHFSAAIEYWEGQKEDRQVSAILVNMGIANRRMKRFDKAEESFTKSLQLFREQEYNKGIVSALINLGRLYEDLANYDKALSFYQEALNESDPKENLHTSITLLTNIYSVQSKSQKTDSAHSYYQKAYSLAKSVKSISHLQKILQRRAEHFILQNNPKESLEILDQSMSYAQEMGKLPAIMEVEELMGKAWQAMGDSGKALVHFLHFKELQDSLITEKARKQMEEIEITRTLKQKEEDIIRLKAENDAQTFRFYASLGIILLALIAVFALFYLVRNKQKSNKVLSESNEQIHLQNKTLETQKEEIKNQHQQLTRQHEEMKLFTDMAAHDLHQPLRTLKEYLSLIQQVQLEEKGKEYLGYAVEGANRMDQLFKDFLLYARIGEGSPAPSEFELSQIFEEIKANLATSIKENQAEISIGPLPTLSAHRSLIYILFQNLISNALKFHKPDQPPIIDITASQTPEGWTISIQDNGIGIPSDQQEKIFTTFERLHSADTYPGTGLGLAICHKIVDMHGWTMGVDSKEGDGARFWVRV